jgi:hypothetical protein
MHTHSALTGPHFGLFRCLTCEYEFADRVPPLHEDRPFCPVCGDPEGQQAEIELGEIVLPSDPVVLLELLAPAAS